MIGYLGAAATALLRGLDAEDAHRLTIASAAAFAEARARAGRSPSRDEGFRARFSQSGRSRRRLRQERRGVRRDAGLGLWLCRGRDAHSASPAGQRAPARLSPPRGSRRHQPLWLQQRRPRAGVEAPRGARATRNCRRQYRGEQGRQRPRPGLRGGRARLRRGGRLFHDQYFLAQYAGTARFAGAEGARRPPRARHRRPRGRADAPSAAAQNRARSRHCRNSTTSCASPARPKSTA